MYKRDFDIVKNLTLAEALMLDLKSTNPEAHKRVVKKWAESMQSITPDSKTGPTIHEFIMELFSDYKNELAKAN